LSIQTSLNISELRSRIDRELSQLQFGESPAELYDPIKYTLSIGGKRMRPVILLMACDLFNDNIEPAIPAALAIETFHNFTLVHDDLMDEAPIRRNEKTVHVKWNPNTAILSGDTMLVKAYELLSKCDMEVLPKTLNAFNKAAFEVCEGQQMDMTFENSNDVSIENYLDMIGLKTAALLAVSLQIGALIGGADDEDADHLYQFGKNIGIAFQLQDDILDIYGDPEKFGKQVGGDILSGKKTYLTLKARELADDETATQLNELFASSSIQPREKVAAVREIYNKLDVKSHAIDQMKEYHQRGMANIDLVNIEDDKRNAIVQFTEGLMLREI